MMYAEKHHFVLVGCGSIAGGVCHPQLCEQLDQYRRDGVQIIVSICEPIVSRRQKAIQFFREAGYAIDGEYASLAEFVEKAVVGVTTVLAYVVCSPSARHVLDMKLALANPMGMATYVFMEKPLRGFRLTEEQEAEFSQLVHEHSACITPNYCEMYGPCAAGLDRYLCDNPGYILEDVSVVWKNSVGAALVRGSRERTGPLLGSSVSADKLSHPISILSYILWQHNQTILQWHLAETTELLMQNPESDSFISAIHSEETMLREDAASARSSLAGYLVTTAGRVRVRCGGDWLYTADDKLSDDIETIAGGPVVHRSEGNNDIRFMAFRFRHHTTRAVLYGQANCLSRPGIEPFVRVRKAHEKPWLPLDLDLSQGGYDVSIAHFLQQVILGRQPASDVAELASMESALARAFHRRVLPSAEMQHARWQKVVSHFTGEASTTPASGVA